jgi:glutamine cyclotransferase
MALSPPASLLPPPAPPRRSTLLLLGGALCALLGALLLLRGPPAAFSASLFAAPSPPPHAAPFAYASAPPAAAAPAPVSARTRSSKVPTMWRVVRRVQHDPGSFTQGLEWRGRVLYEGTGLNDASKVSRVSLAGGKYAPLASVSLAHEYFGEGVTLWPGDAPPGAAPAPALLQLTWQERTVFVWDADTLAPRGKYSFASTHNQGWGLTHDEARLIESDGSDRLHFWSPDAAAYAAAGAMVEVAPPVGVRDAVAGAAGAAVALPAGARPAGGDWRPAGGPAVTRPGAPGAPVGALNELEYVHGWVFANIWQSNHVAVIDPATGDVAWFFDFSELKAENGGDVLNGLAYTMHSDVTAEEGAPHAAPAGEVWGGRLWVT